MSGARGEDADVLVGELVDGPSGAVDVSDCTVLGEGAETVYAYGYRCAPDRLKIGSCRGDAASRVANQIATGTPDRPVLFLEIRTHDCRALERVLHGLFRLQGRKIEGAGAEWFLVSRDEVIAACRRVLG